MTRAHSERFRTRLLVQPLEARDLPSFLPPVTYPVGPKAEDVAVADVNNDGRPDVVFAGIKDDTVAVLIGNGDGTLQAPVFYATGSYDPYGVRVADLNGDGKPDLVTANYNDVSVLLNQGNGTFGAAHTYGEFTFATFRVAVGDVDGDRIPDVAVSDYNGNELEVLHGKGDGTLGRAKVYGVNPFSQSVQITDLDGDGIGDISVDQLYNTVTILYGTGAIVTYQAQKLNYGHAVADVNGDGWPDLIVGGLSGYLSVLLNKGDGTFRPKIDVYVGKQNAFPVIADFNRDGTPDIAVGDYPSGDLTVLLGNGNGTFQAPINYAASQGMLIPAAGDLNRDHYPDVVAAGQNSTTVSVLLNDRSWTAPVPPPGQGRAVGDGLVAVLPGAPSGTAPPPAIAPAPLDGGSSSPIAVAAPARPAGPKNATDVWPEDAFVSVMLEPPLA
jgi:hypothetical protein